MPLHGSDGGRERERTRAKSCCTDKGGEGSVGGDLE